MYRASTTWGERAGKHNGTPERMREGEREGLRPRCDSEIESWSESRSELTGKQDSHRARERKEELTMNVRAAKELAETVGESKMKQRQHAMAGPPSSERNIVPVIESDHRSL